MARKRKKATLSQIKKIFPFKSFGEVIGALTALRDGFGTVEHLVKLYAYQRMKEHRYENDELKVLAQERAQKLANLLPEEAVAEINDIVKTVWETNAFIKIDQAMQSLEEVVQKIEGGKYGREPIQKDHLRIDRFL